MTPSILIFGDYHIYGKYDRLLQQNPDHQTFGDDMRELVLSSDLSLFNLEDPITLSRDGLLKHGPYGMGGPDTLNPVKTLGFDAVTFATNHTWDFKRKGLEDTIKYCSEAGLRVIGTGYTLDEARQIPWFEAAGKRVAILNYARSEFSAANHTHGGANPLDIIQMTQDIQTARPEAAAVIVVIHAGVDTCPYPSPEMVRLAQYLVEQGASAVLYHHARAVSGYETYKGAPIFYGLGNLLHYTERESSRAEHEGLGVKLLLEGGRVAFELHPVRLRHNEARVELLEGDEKAAFMRKLDELNAIIADENELYKRWFEWVDKKLGTVYLAQLTGFPVFAYRVARKLKMLPLLRSLFLRRRKRLLQIWNTTRCETHFEALDAILNHEFYGKDNR